MPRQKSKVQNWTRIFVSYPNIGKNLGDSTTRHRWLSRNSALITRIKQEEDEEDPLTVFAVLIAFLYRVVRLKHRYRVIGCDKGSGLREKDVKNKESLRDYLVGVDKA
jgi:hypothetical protein